MKDLATRAAELEELAGRYAAESVHADSRWDIKCRHKYGKETWNIYSARGLVAECRFQSWAEILVALHNDAIPLIRDLLKEVERLSGVIQKIMPPEPNLDAHDGPCCYTLTRLDSGKERWVGTGCDCMNSGDTENAARWADDANLRLDILDLLSADFPAKDEEMKG